MSRVPGWLKTAVGMALFVSAFVPHREPAIEADPEVRSLMETEVRIVAGPEDPLAGVNPGAILAPRPRRPEVHWEFGELVVTRGLLWVLVDGVLHSRHPKYRVVAHFERDGTPGCAVFRLQRSVQDDRWYARSSNSSSCSTWW